MSYILGMGTCHPTTVIDNKFLEDLDVGTTAQWIEEKIGIKTRFTTLTLDYIKTTRNQDPRLTREVVTTTTTEMGVKASLQAIENAGISASDIGLVVCNCCTPRNTFPTESQRITEQLGISAVALDVFTACPAFALHTDFLLNYRGERLPDYILCISTATLTQHVNYNDRSDGAIWGDGAAAWVISPRQKGPIEILSSSFTADPTRCEAVVVDHHQFFHQDGRAVRDFSVRQTVRLIKGLEESYPVDWSRDIFIGHQANRTMLEQITNNREIPASGHWQNVSEYGNQAGAGAPAVLSMNWNKRTKGQFIVTAVVGAGLSWGTVMMKVLD